MNKNLIYFSTRVFMLGFIFSSIINFTKQDSIFCLIIGSILGTFIIYILKKLNYNSIYFKIILFVTCLTFIALASTILEMFTSSFFLINTPKIIIIIPSIFICLYTIFKDQNLIYRISYILFYISIILILIVFISLIKNIKLNSVLPFFTSKKINYFKSILCYGIGSSFPHIILYKEDIPFKCHIKTYLFTNLINLTILFFTLSVLTPNVAKIYSFPEYIVLKRIKMLNFIENIENIMASIWYLDLYIFMCLTYNCIYDLVKNKYIISSIVIIFNIIISLFLINNYNNIFYIYNYYYIILCILFILLLPCIKKE